MDAIKKGIAFFAGYNMRLVVIIQGKSQLESIYQASGLSEFIANFKYQIVFAPNDPKEAKDLSDSLGTFTVETYSKSIPGIFSKGDRSMNQSQASRALIMADEVLRLDRTKAIVRVEAQRPILADKIIYYADTRFIGKFNNLYNKESTLHLAPKEPPALMENKEEIAAREQAEENIRLENIEKKKEQARKEFSDRKAHAAAGNLEDFYDDVEKDSEDDQKTIEDILRREQEKRTSLVDQLHNEFGMIDFAEDPDDTTTTTAESDPNNLPPGETDSKSPTIGSQDPEENIAGTYNNENMSWSRDGDDEDNDISRPRPQPETTTPDTTGMDDFLFKPPEDDEQDSGNGTTGSDSAPASDAHTKEKDGRTNRPLRDHASFQHRKDMHEDEKKHRPSDP